MSDNEMMTLDVNLYLARIIIAYCKGEFPKESDFEGFKRASANIILQDFEESMSLLGRFVNIVNYGSFKAFRELEQSKKYVAIDHMVDMFNSKIHEINTEFFKLYFRMLTMDVINVDPDEIKSILKKLLDMNPTNIDEEYQKDVASRYIDILLAKNDADLDELIKVTERLERLNKK